MKRGTSISTYLRPLAEQTHQVYLTNELQVADVLEWILSQVGRAEIWQTSFSISEEFLRRLFFIEQEGKVAKFNLILDFKATQKTLRLWPFICQTMQHVYLADNHSKVLLVQSQKGDKVSIITSQNLTRGNRNEAYIITTDPKVFDKFLHEVQDLIKCHSVPLSEILQNKIGVQ